MVFELLTSLQYPTLELPRDWPCALGCYDGSVIHASYFDVREVSSRGLPLWADRVLANEARVGKQITDDACGVWTVGWGFSDMSKQTYAERKAFWDLNMHRHLSVTQNIHLFYLF